MSKQLELESQTPTPEAALQNTPRDTKEKENEKEKEDSISYFKLYCCANKQDWLLMIFGSIAAVINGAGMPLLSLLFGDVADDFGPLNSPDAVVKSAGRLALQLMGVGIGVIIASYIAIACWMIAGERQAIRIRKKYFKSLLSQEIAFFDSINPNELSTKIAEECFNIQGGIGEKVSTFIYSLSMFVVGFIIGFIKGWQLSLVLTGFLPILVVTGALFAFSIQKATMTNNAAYGKAGAISEEVLNAIRTVTSLGGQNKEKGRYQVALEHNRTRVTKFGVFSGLALGLMNFAMLAMHALGFYIGSIFVDKRVKNLVTGNPYTGGDVLTVFLSITMAAFTFSQAAPAVKFFAIAKAAGAKAFKIIDRKSQIEIDDGRGARLEKIEGNIDFKNVKFAYPLKPDRVILNEISFCIKKNEKTAFVGESGCGKTTCMQLIERFYDLDTEKGGSITLDGHELRGLNLKWMRENIGYVGQEPVLFATTIKENMMMAKEDATDAQIWEALKKANAADFVQGLPDKLNTFVGNSGSALSGGQKQRLAIARAILKDPKILLLDEATSALDRKNEMEIQKTLDEISTGRTTIVIAHRLSTVINADHIIVFDGGKIVEEGKHDELVAKEGKYYALQHLQLQAEEKEQENVDKKKSDDKVQTDQDQGKTSSSMQNQYNKTEGVDLEIQQQNIGEPQKATAEGDQVKKKNKKEDVQIFKRLFQENKKDQPLIVFGMFIALLNGCVFPSMALILAEIMDAFALPDASDFRSRANLYSLLFLVLAIIALILDSIQQSLFNYIAENLSRKVRLDVFNKYLKMPIGWFDLPENAPGALCSKLAKDAALINSLTSTVVGVFTQAAGSFISGMIFGFIASWQLTLIGLALSPLNIISGKMESQFNQGFSADTDEAYKASAAFVGEAVNNMRTVASFGKEDKLLENYSRQLEKPLKKAIKKGNMSGLFYGLSQGMNVFTYAIVFYIGAIFIRDINLSYKNMLQSVFAIMFAAQGTGNALHFAPDIGSAMNAAVSIFKILDTKADIDMDDPKQNVRTKVIGNIEFRNVAFKYPTREKQIFNDLNFTIKAGTKVALVGTSGCGKSTILALLQRFYDPDQGDIFIDGVSIKKYDLRFLRECFGVVSQEPVLFNGTIEYNIK